MSKSNATDGYEKIVSITWLNTLEEGCYKAIDEDGQGYFLIKGEMGWVNQYGGFDSSLKVFKRYRGIVRLEAPSVNLPSPLESLRFLSADDRGPNDKLREAASRFKSGQAMLEVADLIEDPEIAKCLGVE